MLFGEVQHTLDPSARPFLAELHLKDSIVNRLARDLSSKFVKFPLRNFEVGCRVLVLEKQPDGQYWRCEDAVVYANLGALLPRSDGDSQSRFLSIGGGDSLE